MFFPRQLLTAICAFLLAGCAGDWATGRGRHTMWEVRDDNNVVYLLGSVHVLPKTAQPFPTVVEKAYQDSSKIVFEIDLSRYSDEAIARQVERDGSYPKGDDLTKHLSDPGRQILEAALPLFGTDLDSVKGYHAWFLADALLSKYLYDRGIRSEYGVDSYLFEKAKADRKKVGGLELLQAQTGIYRGISDQEAEAYLLGTILSLPDIERTIREIAQAWRKGQTHKLDDLLNAQAERSPKMATAMFGTRNRAWLPAIRAMIKGSTDTMVVVGAGHLVGRDGIVTKLREAGYTVNQL